MRNSKIIRKFERFLFKGIPEQPEPVWERDDNANVFMRQTGKSQSSSSGSDISTDSQLIGTFTYNLEDQSELYQSNI
jgi:hypothetical protein